MSDDKRTFEASEFPQGEGKRTRRRRRNGRNNDMPGDVMNLQKGAMFAGIEAVSAAVDIAASVARSTADRAFSKDYRQPGDVLRGVTRDAGDTVKDAIDQARDVPQRVTDAFYEAVPKRKSSSRGERYRRAQQNLDED